jgi:hypothetical protein
MVVHAPFSSGYVSDRRTAGDEAGPRRPPFGWGNPSTIPPRRALVSVEELVGRLWDTAPPAKAKAALHVQMARLRRALGTPDPIQTVAAGYRIAVQRGQLDLERFDALVRRAGETGDPAERSRHMSEAVLGHRNIGGGRERRRGVQLILRSPVPTATGTGSVSTVSSLLAPCCRGIADSSRGIGRGRTAGHARLPNA